MRGKDVHPPSGSFVTHICFCMQRAKQE